MFKRKLTIPDFFLILVNLIPLIGVWFNEWNAKQIFLVYCMETVIIGLINVIKMAIVTLFVKKKDVFPEVCAPWSLRSILTALRVVAHQI